MIIKHKSDQNTYKLTITNIPAPLGHPLLLGWNLQAPQSPSRGRALPTKPASSQCLPLRLSISQASSLLALCTCDSPSCHGALLSLDASTWNLPTTCHHFTQWIPVHSPGLDSNISCSGSLCWGPQSSSGLSQIQLLQTYNSVLCNLQFSSLLTRLLVWPFVHAYTAFSGTWWNGCCLFGLISISPAPNSAQCRCTINVWWMSKQMTFND